MEEIDFGDAQKSANLALGMFAKAEFEELNKLAKILQEQNMRILGKPMNKK